MQRSLSLFRQLPKSMARGRSLSARRPFVVQSNVIRNIAIRPLATTAAATDEDMFCFQCEQTKNRTGCVEIGVCGKTPEVAKLQDLSVYMCKANAFYLNELFEAGAKVDMKHVDKIIDVLFATVTNVNFDADRFMKYLGELMKEFNHLKAVYEKVVPKDKQKTMLFAVHDKLGYKIKGYSQEQLEEIATTVGVRQQQSVLGPSLAGVREMVTYGIKGSATYWAHAERLGMSDESIQRDFIKLLAWLVNTENQTNDEALGQALGKALEVGELNLRVMDKLDAGHRKLLGVPSPAQARMYPKPGPAILVSGHDMQDLLAVLEATKDKGINVYTHGELLPAHGYPNLRKYKNLAGNFGGAWQIQQFEFPSFPGPILVTTNCLIEPRLSYIDRIYTMNAVGWPGAKHVDAHKKQDLDKIIAQALEMKGFSAEECEKMKRDDVTVGFGRETILGAAGTVLEEIEKGNLKHIFLVGGCDGSENRRSWFTNMVAMALADALKTDINSLPLSLAISWFEQKAVAVLLTLLHLGVKNIRLGPVMPGFLTDEVYEILHDKFNVLPIDMKKKRDPVADVKLMMDDHTKQLGASGAGRKKR